MMLYLLTLPLESHATSQILVLNNEAVSKKG